MIAFLPAPVSTPFHAAAWSWCWPARSARTSTTAGGTAPSLPCGRRVDAGLVRADREVLERRGERDDREVAGQLLADAAAGTPPCRVRAAAAREPLPAPLPDERDPAEQRTATEQERASAGRRRHEVA